MVEETQSESIKPALTVEGWVFKRRGDMAQKRKLNIELFKKVRDRIAAIPESYDQYDYFAPNSKAPCGRAACIAGEAIICDAPTIKEGINRLKFYSEDETVTVADHAAELLGLEYPDWGGGNIQAFNSTARLFACFSEYKVRWPEPYATAFAVANCPTERAAVAVRYLDHIIETGNVLD